MKSSLQRKEKTLDPSGVLWRALVGSLALHALAFGMLFSSLGGDGRQVPPDRLLQGHLVLPALPGAVPTQPLPDPPPIAPAARPLTPVVATPAKLPDGIPLLRAEPVRTVPPTSTVEPVPRSRADAQTGGVPASNEDPVPPTVAMVEEPQTAGPDAAGLRQFRLALAGEARRFRRYPETARREGLAGTAEVRVAVAAGGAERLAELTRSSGHAALDAAALDMLQQALARTPLPESLRGQRFAVLLPVVFSVED